MSACNGFPAMLSVSITLVIVWQPLNWYLACLYLHQTSCLVGWCIEFILSVKTLSVFFWNTRRLHHWTHCNMCSATGNWGENTYDAQTLTRKQRQSLFLNAMHSMRNGTSLLIFNNQEYQQTFEVLLGRSLLCMNSMSFTASYSTYFCATGRVDAS